MQAAGYKVTISLPCFGRPERTKRAIDCILAQDMNGWEALVTGDCCPHFQKLINSDWLEEKVKEASLKGNSLIYKNLDKNYGGCGYFITNENIQSARGKYMIFYANDDIILPNHFSNYLEIENTDLDFMYFNSFIAPINEIRESKLAPSCIGHSEIIVKTELAKKAPPHESKYGHDWDFIHYIMNTGKGIKSASTLTTYHVRSVPNYGTVDKID